MEFLVTQKNLKSLLYQILYIEIIDKNNDVIVYVSEMLRIIFNFCKTHNIAADNNEIEKCFNWIFCQISPNGFADYFLNKVWKLLPIENQYILCINVNAENRDELIKKFEL